MSIIVYIIAEFINVILSTIKYIVTVKAKASTAAYVNALTSTVGAVTTKLLTAQGLEVIIPTVLCANLVGVRIGRLIVERLEKDKLFIFNATIRFSRTEAEIFRKDLKDKYGITSIFNEIIEDKMYDFKIFSTSKLASNIVAELLATMPAKYHKIESR